MKHSIVSVMFVLSMVATSACGSMPSAGIDDSATTSDATPDGQTAPPPPPEFAPSLACVAGETSCRECVRTQNGQWGFCTNQCVNTNSDPANCGGCGLACGGGPAVICVNGGCQCGGVMCGSSCVDIVNDPNNCEWCGHVCPSGVCAFGFCQ